jgi:hypothetical protein
MWKRIAVLLGIYIIFRELFFSRRADSLDYELMLAECRKRGWESCDELKETLECSRRLIEEIPNPDELKRLREKEVEKMLQQNPDLTRKKLEEADKLLAITEKDGFGPEKVVAEHMFHIQPDLTQVLLEVWLRERKAHLELLRNKLQGV